MTQTYQNPNVVEACTSENRLEALEDLSERLDATQKSLSNYLDTKRNSFPRFFFISDDELLSVLGSSDPTSIQVWNKHWTVATCRCLTASLLGVGVWLGQ